MIRRPPISPLFPSTPLFRSGAVRAVREPPLQATRFIHPRVLRGVWRGSVPRLRRTPGGSRDGRSRDLRSEEHTSELQSRQYLVCRLLLEKKKQLIIYSYTFH